MLPLLKYITRKEPTRQTPTMRVVAALRDQPSDSSKKASAAGYIEIELAIAARYSMKSHSAPTAGPMGRICAKTTGRVLKPGPKVPPAAAAIVPLRPRNTKAAVRVRSPP